jgi:hypothetical protein
VVELKLRPVVVVDRQIIGQVQALGSHLMRKHSEVTASRFSMVRNLFLRSLP